LITYQNIIGRNPGPIMFSEEETNLLSTLRVLVTGAGGSIGSRIVSLLSTIPGLVLKATDRDETALHTLSLNLTQTALFDSSSYELLDIRDEKGIENCISEFRPTAIVHAAALKHLSVLQRQPREAVLTNVFGSANLVDSAARFGVEHFVNISTDKAADPTSILGISKLLAEHYVSDLRNRKFPRYTSCRFGNVFNSRGSVIETFLKQIQTGSPITITDPEITRLFMHVDEAAYLSVKSLLINQNDVHIFQMGEPVSLISVVTNMQRVMNSTCPVLVTGLRPGEKMHENLVGAQEVLFKTSDSRIKGLNLPNLSENLSKAFQFINERDEPRLTEFLINFSNEK